MNNIIILVVDDNLVSRLLPSFILKPFSGLVQVLECECSSDALCLIRTHKVTHVLLDISMPVMDGIKVAQNIRSISEYSEIRLIAYTANVRVADVAYLKSLGFNDVLLKPIIRAELLKSLDIIES